MVGVATNGRYELRCATLPSRRSGYRSSAVGCKASHKACGKAGSKAIHAMPMAGGISRSGRSGRTATAFLAHVMCRGVHCRLSSFRWLLFLCDGPSHRVESFAFACRFHGRVGGSYTASATSGSSCQDDQCIPNSMPNTIWGSGPASVSQATAFCQHFSRISNNPETRK